MQLTKVLQVIGDVNKVLRGDFYVERASVVIFCPKECL